MLNLGGSSSERRANLIPAVPKRFAGARIAHRGCHFDDLHPTYWCEWGTAPGFVDSLTCATGWRQFEPCQRSSRAIEEVEFATLDWVHWLTTARLRARHGHRAPGGGQSRLLR